MIIFQLQRLYSATSTENGEREGEEGNIFEERDRGTF
jgi:hypothetical protein